MKNSKPLIIAYNSFLVCFSIGAQRLILELNDTRLVGFLNYILGSICALLLVLGYKLFNEVPNE